MTPSRHTRRTNGSACWICKLRHKKCDEQLSTCGNCDSLKIECRYGSKPSWMDGGAGQKRKAASLKEEIKRNVANKREQAKGDNNSVPGVAYGRFDVISNIAVAAVSVDAQSTMPSGTSDQASTLGIMTAPSKGPELIDTLPWSYQQHQRLDTLECASSSEWNFIMKYIDFVFPATFPFYQPHIFDTGRSWLLLLLRTNGIAYHAALGLSCYYFTLALSDVEAGNEHAACKNMRWAEANKETEKCFDSLRAGISELHLSQGTPRMPTVKKVELMNSITQVIIFEVSMGTSTPWNTHLPAALRLFEEIMAGPEARPTYRGQRQSKFASVLLGIGEPLWTNPWPSSHIWSPEQTGFRFCAGYLIFMDIMASVALGRTPQLAPYHCDVLAQVDDGKSAVGEAELQLSTIIGCRNWVATSIADVSALITLKEICSSEHWAGLADDRAVAVADMQNRNLRIVQESVVAIDSCSLDHSSEPDLRLLNQGSASPSSSIVTLIWGLAAEIYRLTVVTGWNTDDPNIRKDVSQIVRLFENIPLDQLRTLAWPISVAGCLASKKEESAFTALFSQLGSVQTVGPLKDSRQLVERAWQNRSKLDRSGHDLASGLAAIGSPILII